MQSATRGMSDTRTLRINALSGRRKGALSVYRASNAHASVRRHDGRLAAGPPCVGAVRAAAVRSRKRRSDGPRHSPSTGYRYDAPRLGRHFEAAHVGVQAAARVAVAHGLDRLLEDVDRMPRLCVRTGP